MRESPSRSSPRQSQQRRVASFASHSLVRVDRTTRRAGRADASCERPRNVQRLACEETRRLGRLQKAHAIGEQNRRRSLVGCQGRLGELPERLIRLEQSAKGEILRAHSTRALDCCAFDICAQRPQLLLESRDSRTPIGNLCTQRERLVECGGELARIRNETGLSRKQQSSDFCDTRILSGLRISFHWHLCVTLRPATRCASWATHRSHCRDRKCV